MATAGYRGDRVARRPSGGGGSALALLEAVALLGIGLLL